VTNASTTHRFRVFRYARDGRVDRFDEFDVPVDESATVLQGLRWIQRQSDRSLSFRHSCFHASCGTCGVRANGREALACVTRVETETVTIEPLANIPVLTDLVVDMRPFFERYAPEHPLLRATERTPASLDRVSAGPFERLEDCIECGLCLSACPIAATDDRYVGPAALAWAQRVLEEPRGASVNDVLDWADAEHGAWQCHAAFECTEACPSGVFPAERIMKLRRALTGRRPSERP
jgi:succinate dehydrogenase / fumarate reductase, iron-sulfur subunit